MTIKRYALMLALTAILAGATFVNAASEESSLRVKVLSSEFHRTVLSSDQAPQECDQINYSGYCHGTRTESVQNIMVIEDNGGKSYRVGCVVDTRWSKCEALTVGAMFDARMEKHGITIFYVNDQGKPRKQLYTFVAPKKESAPVATAAQASPAASPSILEPAPVSTSPVTVAQSAHPALPVEQASSPAVNVASNRETVRCSFKSTPAGAEITLDGRYFGNTPSVLGLTTGTHVVVLFAPGFAQWKKELTVAPGSEVNVSATLQKTQQ
jgi:hypothetical protein